LRAEAELQKKQEEAKVAASDSEEGEEGGPEVIVLPKEEPGTMGEMKQESSESATE
jgi:hypothetical protein